MASFTNIRPTEGTPIYDQVKQEYAAKADPASTAPAPDKPRPAGPSLLLSWIRS